MYDLSVPVRAVFTLLGVVALLVLAACGGDDEAGGAATSEESTNTQATVPQEASPDAASDSDEQSGGRVAIPNEGGQQEGHTPRGFEGFGTGLFAGDNLNPGFPDGDGVQLFLTFSLDEVPTAGVRSATLSTEFASETGTPYVDLGELAAAEVLYDEFGPQLWNLSPVEDGAACVFATSADGPFTCDLTSAVERSLADGHPYVQFRLRFERVADGDGQADLAAFFITNSNTNEPGIFTLTLESR
jgi:hypothetical protein